MKMDLLPVVVVSAKDGNLKARTFFFSFRRHKNVDFQGDENVTGLKRKF